MLMGRQTGKSRCRDTLRREKTGILWDILWKQQTDSIDNVSSCLSAYACSFYISRGKFRLKRKIESSSGLEMYLGHQMRMPVANFQPTQSNSSSLDQHEVFNTGYGFVDKQPKNPGLSVDLNNQGGNSSKL